MHFLDAVTTAYEYQGFWGSFWDIIWWFLWIFFFIAYLFALFAVIGDLFRDHKLNGWWKAVWIIFLIFVPFLTLLVYLIARGNGMAERGAKQAAELQSAQDAYIKSVAGSGGASAADEIAKAKGLLDAGTITQAEYDALKAKALELISTRAATRRTAKRPCPPSRVDGGVSGRRVDDARDHLVGRGVLARAGWACPGRGSRSSR